MCCLARSWVRTWHDVAALVALPAAHGEQSGVVALLHHEEGYRGPIVWAHIGARRPDLRAVARSSSLCCIK